MELNIGSNVMRNINGILKVQGKDQIALEIGEAHGELLLTMEIFDSNGKLIGKLVRNAWVFNDKDNFEITTNPKSLKLIDKCTNNVIVEAEIIDKDHVKIPQGQFYTHKGHPIKITPNELILPGNNRLIGCTFEGGGTAIGIG